ncbi:hypothetical protein ACFPN2_05055 [Steroidobacter flavus]|uniref:Thioredoxin family protein n=1 Tax=Steroidobacter flavus TaxID=1842136 RepID=A0ABV8SLI0_9GAMM
MRLDDDSFLLTCERSGHEPQQVREAFMNLRHLKVERRLAEQEAQAAIAGYRQVLGDYMDALFLPKVAARVVAENTRIDVPTGAEPVGYYCGLIRSAQRKLATYRPEEMTSDEAAAHASWIEWANSGQYTAATMEEIEAERFAQMPSVVVLTTATFDDAFKAFPEPTIVYFHKPRIGVPDACLRLQRLAREFHPYGRVARVDVLQNNDLATRFMILLSPEPLLLFDMNGSLKGYMSAEEPFETIAAWFERRVAPMRRIMTDPEKRAQLQQWRIQRARGEL